MTALATLCKTKRKADVSDFPPLILLCDFAARVLASRNKTEAPLFLDEEPEGLTDLTNWSIMLPAMEKGASFLRQTG